MFGFACYAHIRHARITDRIIIRDLYDSQRFSVYVEDPAAAKRLEEILVHRIAALKQIIDENADGPMKVIEL